MAIEGAEDVAVDEGGTKMSKYRIRESVVNNVFSLKQVPNGEIEIVVTVDGMDHCVAFIDSGTGELNLDNSIGESGLPVSENGTWQTRVY